VLGCLSAGPCRRHFSSRESAAKADTNLLFLPESCLAAAIRSHLSSIASAAATAAEALDGNALDVSEGTLASILSELVSLDGRLDLALDRIAVALDPVGCAR
jgi:hypothetical protein